MKTKKNPRAKKARKQLKKGKSLEATKPLQVAVNKVGHMQDARLSRR